MNKYIKKALKYVYKIVIVASLVSMNVTCLGRYYQEEMDEQLETLRKYKDEKFFLICALNGYKEEILNGIY